MGVLVMPASMSSRASAVEATASMWTPGWSWMAWAIWGAPWPYAFALMTATSVLRGCEPFWRMSAATSTLWRRAARLISAQVRSWVVSLGAGTFCYVILGH